MRKQINSGKLLHDGIKKDSCLYELEQKKRLFSEQQIDTRRSMDRFKRSGARYFTNELCCPARSLNEATDHSRGSLVFIGF
ncbi:hypothetical protein [Paenibacillus terrigena]|uniref:hypothetical protein n=1 Tax=Paenibacillus terrigena TaxID=369333 RepID=UPI0028D21A52|nr:hypothetical protein [Paenibacillus terrigena]